MADLDAARETLLAQLREHSLVLGEVTLSSGATAQYYVDARRTLMRPAGFHAAGELIAAVARSSAPRPSAGRPPPRSHPPAPRSRCPPAPGSSPSSSAASARSTGCSAGSRARWRPACAAWSSRTP